jgi:hypothetical protein
MKTIISVILIYGLFVCWQVPQTSSTIAKETYFSKGINEVNDSIGEIEKPIKLPKGFSLINMENKDTARNLSVLLSIPLGESVKMNSILVSGITEQAEDFIKELDKWIKQQISSQIEMESYFIAKPVSVFKGDKITSILFIISYYKCGEAHPFSMYYAFNFDNKTNKRLYFKDFFVLKNTADKDFYVSVISSVLGVEQVEIKDFKKLDFSVEQDTIVINFDEYEIAAYAAGLIQARIAKSEFEDKIRKEYQNSR